MVNQENYMVLSPEDLKNGLKRKDLFTSSIRCWTITTARFIVLKGGIESWRDAGYPAGVNELDTPPILLHFPYFRDMGETIVGRDAFHA